MADDLIRGVDVSDWQKTVDWRQVAGAGVRFAYLKSSQGGRFRAKTYAANRAGAAAAGVRTGAYHFADLSASPQDNARNFYAAAGQLRAGDLLPCLDLEQTGIPKGTTPEQVDAWAVAFARAWAQLSPHPLVYYGAPARARTPAFAAAFPFLWLARWTTARPVGPFKSWRTWAVWQYSDNGRLPGIAGPVDLDAATPAGLDAITIGGGAGLGATSRRVVGLALIAAGAAYLWRSWRRGSSRT